jgi:hypothetical protein
MELIHQLYLKNATLTVFGLLCFVGALVCLVLIRTTSTEVLGINAWIKPTKFFLSIGIFSLTMAWITAELPASGLITSYNWVLIGVMSFELIYIVLQANKGQLSHFNVSSGYHAFMFSMMGLSISILTLYTLVIGIRFFSPEIDLPVGYLWGIRLGIILFVIFAFEGALMGSRLSHTVGAPDGGEGLKFLNWSITHGDLRVAHFVGMHALQVLPLLGYFILKSEKGIFLVSGLYLLLSLFVLFQALNGKSVIKTKKYSAITANIDK